MASRLAVRRLSICTAVCSKRFEICRRTLASVAREGKGEGDISAAFASLSGIEFKPLDQKYARIKAQLIAGHEDAVIKSWHRLLQALRDEIPTIIRDGSKVIPEIAFSDIDSGDDHFRSELKKRGVAIVRDVIPRDEALTMKHDLREYIADNPHTKAFPANNPQVWELYWSPSQIRARSDPRLLKAQAFLMQQWHSNNAAALVSSSHPVIYADRLRMRMPGDSSFALGPHVDGGSCERWDPDGYGRGRVYDKIWKGRWEEYDPWESGCRLPVQSDLHQGIGACSMFRMFQGWLSLSKAGPFQGTLLVNPLLSHATAYFLLRPFFSPRSSDASTESYLESENWRLDLSESNSWLQGATPGHGQELREQLHPHLRLAESMIHIPTVNPGDYVAWHCDTIHAVDTVHQGESDSSVMYIPSCPVTESNAHFLAEQRQRFLEGTPSPDFGGGSGESQHIGRPGVAEVERAGGDVGLRAFGLKAWSVDEPGLSDGQRQVLKLANENLGFI